MRRIILFLAILLVLPMVFGQNVPEQVIANSADWRDVYSTVIYGKLLGAQTNFLVGQKHSVILLYSIPLEKKIFIASSAKNPYAVSYKSIFDAQGYKSVTEIASADLNLDLAKRSTSVKNFIVVDDSYGYNALSVAPYAIKEKAYVLFADKRSIGKIVTFLDSRGVNSILLYGPLDREVRDRLAKYKPEVIDEGDRYQNNVALVKKFRAKYSNSQVLFSNGEFIEDQLLGGVEPVLFIGTNNVPDAIRDYIKSSDIKVGVLVGNELIGTATFIRRQLGISVFVKFAQGARVPGNAVAQVEDLDRFPLPKYALSLSLYSIKYNQFTNTLEVTYHNDVDQAAYFKGSIALSSAEGSQTVGDSDSIFIDGGEYRTVTYAVTSMTGNITANLFTLFGESKKSFEYSLQLNVPVDTVKVSDKSQIELRSVVYDKSHARFLIEVRNPTSEDVYVTLEIPNLLVNDIETSYGSKDEMLIPAGKTIAMEILVDDLSAADIAANPQIRVIGRFGSRPHILTNIVEQTFPFKEKGFDVVTIALIGVLIIIIFLIILAIRRRRQQEEEE